MTMWRMWTSLLLAMTSATHNRAGTESGVEQRERAVPAVQGADGEEGQRDGEVVGEHPDGAEHDERNPEVGVVGDVAQAGEDVALGSGSRGEPAQLGGPHHPQRAQYDQIRRGVDAEAPAVADGDREHAGQGWPEDAGDIDDQAVEDDSVGAVLRRDHLGDE